MIRTPPPKITGASKRSPGAAETRETNGEGMLLQARAEEDLDVTLRYYHHYQ